MFGVNSGTLKASLVALIAATASLWSAGAKAEDAQPTDLFRFASPIAIPRAVGPAAEDAASPFVTAHPLEQMYYSMIYLEHYGSQPAVFTPDQTRNLPSAVDPQGRPLWFDNGAQSMALEELVAQLLNNGQFNDLERLFDDWSNPNERTADGRWKLGVFEAGISLSFASGTAWDSGYQLIRRWREEHPFAAAAALAEATYWYRYAWNARGTGIAASVSSDAWDLFNERLGKAEAVLVESKPYASRSPLWGRTLLQVGNGLNWSRPKLLQTFTEVTKDEKYFYPSYTTTVHYLTPRWGGDWKLVDAFIRDATKNTQERDGYSMYARLYWELDDCICGGFNLFRDTPANWPDMKRAFEDLIQRYPHSGWTFNKYAAYACLAEDKDAYQGIRFRIGKAIVPEAWPSHQAIDLCEHKFAAKGL